MPKLFEWSAELAIQHDVIDAQHEGVFVLAQEFSDRARSGATHEALSLVLGFLEQYIVDHFATEDTLMAAFPQPEHGQHRLEHQRFIKEFEHWRARFASEGASPTLARALEGWLHAWFLAHIANVDQELVNALPHA